MMNPQNKLSINSVIDKLELSDTPRAIAYSAIAGWANSDDGLRIYFDGSVTCTTADIEPEEILDPNSIDPPILQGLLVASGKPQNMGGTMRLLNITFSEANSSTDILFDRFSIEKDLFYCTDEAAMWVKPVRLSLSNIYCQKDEVEDFYNKLVQHKYFKPLPKGKELGIRKALALLARDKAESSAAYRVGNKVNARQFKAHIIDLAKKYGLDESYLKSIEDRINETLHELDLKELNENEQPTLSNKNPN